MSQLSASIERPAGTSSPNGTRTSIRVIGVYGSDEAPGPATASRAHKVSIFAPSSESASPTDRNPFTPTMGGTHLSQDGSSSTERRARRASEDGSVWRSDNTSAGGDDPASRLSMSAAPVRPTIPLHFATWAGAQHGSTSSIAPGSEHRALENQSYLQSRLGAANSALMRQFSGTTPSLPTALANNKDEERNGTPNGFFSPFSVGADHDSREITLTNSSEADRPTSRRGVFARRMNQLADARVSVYSVADAGFLVECDAEQGSKDEQSGDGSSGNVLRAESGSVSPEEPLCRTSTAVSTQEGVSLGGVVLDGSVPSNLPPEIESAHYPVPIEDTAVMPIHLSESAAQLTTSFMSLSSVGDRGQTVTIFPPPDYVPTERRGTGASPSDALMLQVPRGHLGAPGPRSWGATTSSSKVPSSGSDDRTTDSYGPPHVDRRPTMPLGTQPFCIPVADKEQQHSSDGHGDVEDARDSEFRRCCEEMLEAYTALTKEEDRAFARLLAAEVSACLKLAREVRLRDRAAAPPRHTISSLEDEEVDLAQRAYAARMARAEAESDADLNALLPHLPCRVTLSPPTCTLPRRHEAGGQRSLPDKLKSQIHLVGADNRIEAEIARQLRVQKSLDAKYGPVRYFPAI